ncbi:MAG: hypothetical protein AAFO07_21555 [Bacteroidota bacterium]
MRNIIFAIAGLNGILQSVLSTKSNLGIKFGLFIELLMYWLEKQGGMFEYLEMWGIAVHGFVFVLSVVKPSLQKAIKVMTSL